MVATCLALPGTGRRGNPEQRSTSNVRATLRGLPRYLDHVTVDDEGKAPVYLQIAAILRDAIERGEYAPGRQIPSGTRLMQGYGVARLTARKAVRVLVDAGLIEVVQGRGAYVAERA